MTSCSEHGILPTRMAAIDARRGQQPSMYGAESTRTDVSSETIPPEVVSLLWDSTMNAKFDRKCRINTATPMTPSERACAASHVITWKLIYELFAKQSKPLQTEELSLYLSSYLSTSSGHIEGKSSTPTNDKSSFKKVSSFRPLPNSRVYDAIPDAWLSSPRPQYQMNLVTECNRHAQINSICDVLALRSQSSIEHFGKFVLILEDDAVIDPHPKWRGKNSVHVYSKKLLKKNFLQRVKEIEDKIPSDFDICYLGYNGKTFKKTVKKILVRPEYVWQLHAYLLSPKGAAKLLAQLPVSAPVDNFIAKLIFEKKLEVRTSQQKLKQFKF